ncbi:phage head closure protein [Polaromonas sp.]|uniref:phage head closure protein n=1 Tax=Polaromonas sp. TaxID=1869339 RepID=UPI002487EECF|nr:phage head closure protein [Polaromonas sp.]MDI1342409.1 phage head closure protein [Polaromonas sp.]
MKTGSLDQRVTVERLSVGVDEIGQPYSIWAALVTVWAAVEPLSGREYIAAMSAQSEVTTRIRLRYRPGITSADRVNHEGTLYNITSVIDYKSRNHELVLMCKAQPA